MFKSRKISYGGTAAIITSTALISGLGAAGAERQVIVSALLIAAIADNLSDALSIHMFMESEQFETRQVLIETITNFLARLLVCASFIPLVAVMPLTNLWQAGIAWGAALLTGLTYLVARERKAGILAEIVRHLVVAGVILTLSTAAGHWIGQLLG